MILPFVEEHTEFVVDTLTDDIPPGLVMDVVALKLQSAASVTWKE